MKRFLSVILSIIMLVSLAIPVSAAEANNPQWIQEETIYSDPFIVPELVGKTCPDAIGTYAYGDRTVLGNIFTTAKALYLRPTGQPSLGFEAAEDAYAVFFEASGSSVTFTLSIDGKYFDFTAKTGHYTATGSGIAVRIPSNPGKYILQFTKNYIIRTERYDVYSAGNVYEYSFYIHDPQYSLAYNWLKIG